MRLADRGADELVYPRCGVRMLRELSVLEMCRRTAWSHSKCCTVPCGQMTACLRAREAVLHERAVSRVGWEFGIDVR